MALRPEHDARTIRLDDVGGDKIAKEKVLVCHQLPPREVVRAAVELDATQVVQDTNPYYPAEVNSAIGMLDNPSAFFTLPLSTILTPDNVNDASEKNLMLAEVTFRKTADKDEVLSRIEDTITALARPQSLAYDVKLVADELFMNALYNAPVGADAPKVDRAVNIELPSGKTCRIALGKDDSRLVLVCEDYYGSLDISRYLDRLFKCYQDGVKNAMNWGLGGAGIGCYMVFESCMSIFLGVRPGEKTVVAAVFALGKGTRARQELSKSLHYTKP